jgi:hypothetical protein
MKRFWFVLLIAVPAILGGRIIAAPIESVESTRASVALQKVDAFLAEKAVADRLGSLGMSRDKVQAHLAALTPSQVDELAAQVDLIHAGGTIQHSDRNRLGPLGCMFHQLGVLFHNLYQLVFCWGDLK